MYPYVHIISGKHTHASSRARTHTYTHARTRTRTHTHTHTRTHTHTHTHTCPRMCMLTRARMYVHVAKMSVCAYTRSYIHTSFEGAAHLEARDWLQPTTKCWKYGSTLQHTATHGNTLQHTATQHNTLQNTATHCNTLQHIATHCNTLQQRHARKQAPKDSNTRTFFEEAARLETSRVADAATPFYHARRS